MKKSLIALLIFLSINSYASDTEKEVKSTVKNVTVFLSGAQVTRTGNISVAKGRSVLLFNNISPNIDKQSIQVVITHGIKVLAVSNRLNYFSEVIKTGKTLELEKEQQGLLDFIQQQKNLLEVYTEEESMLKSNKSIGGQQEGVKIEELKAAANYFRERLTNIKGLKFATHQKIKKNQNQLNKIASQLQALNNEKPKPTSEIIVKILSEKSTSAKVNISYLVKNASWYPSYDIRVKNINSPVNITYKANVSQNSGEDWGNVKLTLSTADPSQGSASPSISPWYLGFNNRVLYQRNEFSRHSGVIKGRVLDSSDGSPLPGVNVIIKGTTVGTATDIDGYYSIPLTNNAHTLIYSFIGMESQEVSIGNNNEMDVSLNMDDRQLSEVVVTALGISRSSAPMGYSSRDYSYKKETKKIIAASPVVKQIDMEYKVTLPYTIKSDGKNQAVDMVAYDVPANYQYFCIPKLDKDAFLTAQITDWESYNFLEGEASLFFEEKYIGKTVLDTRSVNDTLEISLGRDKNIIVTREKVKDFSSKKLLGGNQKVMVTYEISVRNKKNLPINIKVKDQFPVSNTKEITIEKIEYSGAKLNNEDGTLTWNFHVKPSNTEKKLLKYSVKYPKHRDLVID